MPYAHPNLDAEGGEVVADRFDDRAAVVADDAQHDLSIRPTRSRARSSPCSPNSDVLSQMSATQTARSGVRGIGADRGQGQSGSAESRTLPESSGIDGRGRFLQPIARLAGSGDRLITKRLLEVALEVVAARVDVLQVRVSGFDVGEVVLGLRMPF